MIARAPALFLLLGSCTQVVQGLDDTRIDLVNVAPGGSASQSSTLAAYDANLAVDRDLDTFSHTSPGRPARWEIVLPQPSVIRRVTIHSRRTCCRDRNRDLNVTVLDAPDGAAQFDYAASTGHLINPGNVLRGPDVLDVDVWQLAGRVVRGSVVRIDRAPDTTETVPYPDSSDRDNNLFSLNLAEVEIWVPRL